MDNTDNTELKRIPMIYQKNRCPVCNKELRCRKRTTLFIYKKYNDKEYVFKKIHYPLPYCKGCHIYCADNNTFEFIKEQYNDYHAYTFNVNNNMTIEDVNKITQLFPYKIKKREKQKEQPQKQKIIIPEINVEENNNSFINELDNYFKIKIKQLNSEKNIDIYICDKDENKNSEVFLVDYKRDDVRIFLSSLLQHNIRNFNYQGEEYFVESYRNQTYNELIPTDIVIKKGGGYSCSIKNGFYHLVDILLYSPFTDKYEVIHATKYDEDEETYIDITVLRKFVKQYGNPELRLCYLDDYSNKKYIDFNEESILHIYGYNVNKADNLSDKERQSILAEIIDLNLMEQTTAVQFLKTRYALEEGKKHYDACSKYSRDINFVMNYKYKPERFLVINN